MTRARLFNIAAAISLSLFVAAIGLFAVSRWRAPVVVLGTSKSWTLADGTTIGVGYDGECVVAYTVAGDGGFGGGARSEVGAPGLSWVSRVGPSGSARGALADYPILVLLFGVLPSARPYRAWHRRGSSAAAGGFPVGP